MGTDKIIHWIMNAIEIQIVNLVWRVWTYDYLNFVTQMSFPPTAMLLGGIFVVQFGMQVRSWTLSQASMKVWL